MTKHNVLIGASQNMGLVGDNSVELIVTSPPYPMIEMWDEIFAKQNNGIGEAIKNDGFLAFELMHLELDKVWNELGRVLVPGGFACINIGDATRTINKKFSLYPNHSRIISHFLGMGFSNLPNIIWKKQTNAPNKFMGSGMLPAGAYVTLEHEWVLIFRKAGKREFISDSDKLKRRKSAYFWEERNAWFSDIWDLKGVKQKMDNPDSRDRSAAYPFELPYRLINMYSLIGDTVLDPFLGLGTTTLAAIASNRNSIGYDIDSFICNFAVENILSKPVDFYNSFVDKRIKNHIDFVENRNSDPNKNEMKYKHPKFEFPVMTAQEKDIIFPNVLKVELGKENIIQVEYGK